MDILKENRLLNTAIILAIMPVIMGFAVITGWYIHSETLVQVLPSFAPMQYNTALCFVLSGLGLYFVISDRNKYSLICASTVFIWAFLTLVQYVLVIDFGIDTLFVEPFTTTKTSHPGRMSPATSICFVITSLAIFLWYWLRNSNLKGTALTIFSAIILIIGATSLSGYIIDETNVYGLSGISRMAIHTSAGFVCISLCLAVYSITIQSNADDSYGFYGLPAISMFIIMNISVFLWINTGKHERNVIKQITQDETEAITNGVNSHLFSYITALERMAQRWEAQGGTPQEIWYADAKNYIQDQQGLRAVEWADNNYHIRWIEPIQGNEAAKDLYLLYDDKRKDLLKNIHLKDTITVTPAFTLKQGGKAFIVYIPVYIKEKFDGFIIGLFDVEELIKAIGKMNFSKSYGVEITINNDIVFTNDNDAEHSSLWKIVEEFDVYGVTWKVGVWPVKQFVEEQKNNLPETILFSGALLSILVSMAIYYAKSASYQAKQTVRSENKLQLILDSAGEGVFGVDTDGNLTFANQAAARMVGYEIQEMLGKSKHDLIHHHHPDGREYPFEEGKIYKAIKYGEKHVEDSEVLWRKDNSSFPVEYTCTPTKNEKGDITGAVIIFRDITSRKKDEEQIQKTQKELESFIYIASHDLRSPLINLKGFTVKLTQHVDKLATYLEKYMNSLTSEEKADVKEIIEEKIPKASRFIQDGVSRIDNMTTAILNLSRTGRRDLKFAKIDTGEMLISCRNVLSHQLKEKSAEIQIENIPDIVADSTAMEQIFGNLLDNALKYLDPQRKGIIHIRCEETHSHYKFEITDNGRGIAKDDTDKVFAIFRRAGNVVNDTQGEGMGLSHTKALVERHGGQIWFESELNKGTTFFFTIDKNLKPTTKRAKNV